MNLKRLTYSILSTIIVYLLVSFVRWDLLCILELSEVKNIDRFFILVFFIMKEFLVSLIYNELEYKNK